MSILFVTGNKGKLQEVQDLLPDVQGIDLDLVEIQEINPRKVIAAKLAEAQKHQQGAFIVEDTSLEFDGMHGLPGPLIKWHLLALKLEGLYHLAEALGNTKAVARTIIGYANAGHIEFFEGTIAGTLVAPRGNHGFGWDAIFQPDGQGQTFAEMAPETKRHYSMRRIAAEGLRLHLEQDQTSNIHAIE